MVTTSQIAKKIVNESMFLHECLGKGMLNYAHAAEYMKPKIEAELGKRIKLSAVIMALRRYEDEIERKYESKFPFDYRSEVTLKSGMIDIAVQRSPAIFGKLKQLYNVIDYEKGDVLNIIHGNHEISIVTNEKNKDKVLRILAYEKILNTDEKLSQLSLRFPKEYMYTPGIILQLTRVLNWEGVNIFEIVSTLTEVNFIISEKDSVKGYRALQELVARG
ncbi:MAG: hypothetical protein V1836_04680 [Candidatus Aenigmatarchaeota archaeon]